MFDVFEPFLFKADKGKRLNHFDVLPGSSVEIPVSGHKRDCTPSFTS